MMISSTHHHPLAQNFRIGLFLSCSLAVCLQASSLLDQSNHQLKFQLPAQPSSSSRPFTKLPSFQDIVSESVARSGEDQLGVLSVEDLNALTQHVASLPEPRLLRWADGHEEYLTEGEKALVIWYEKGRRFVDVTDQPPTESSQAFSTLSLLPSLATHHTFPTKISHGNRTLDSILKDIQTTRMKSRLTELTHFRTR